MAEPQGPDYRLKSLESVMSRQAFDLLHHALKENEQDPLRALAGVCEAYVAQQREISAGYSRRRF